MGMSLSGEEIGKRNAKRFATLKAKKLAGVFSQEELDIIQAALRTEMGKACGDESVTVEQHKEICRLHRIVFAAWVRSVEKGRS